MQHTDRRFIQWMVLAWGVVYVWSLSQTLPSELQRGSSWGVLVFGVVFMALIAVVLTAIVVAIPARVTMNLVLRDRRRSHLSETTVLTVLLTLFIAWVFEVRRERLNLAPPPGVATLSEFADTMPPPLRLELFQNDGRHYIVWTGELSGPVDVPSGHSCYIFDESGHLIDWQPETGDGGPVEDFLDSSAKKRPLTLDEALSIARSTVSLDN